MNEKYKVRIPSEEETKELLTIGAKLYAEASKSTAKMLRISQKTLDMRLD